MTKYVCLECHECPELSPCYISYRCVHENEGIEGSDMPACPWRKNMAEGPMFKGEIISADQLIARVAAAHLMGERDGGSCRALIAALCISNQVSLYVYFYERW